MLSGDQCNGVSDLAEGHSFIRGRCKQLGNLYSPSRDDGRCFSNSDYEFMLHTDEFGSPVDVIEKQSEDICRRVSMTPGDVSNDQSTQTPNTELQTTLASISTSPSDRRSSRDIAIQAFSIEIEEEKRKLCDSKNEKQPPMSQAKSDCDTKCSQIEPYFLREHRPSIFLKRDSCHFHKLISPQNEIIIAHCPGPTPVVEYTDSIDNFKFHEGTSSIEVANDEYQKSCYCFDHCHDSMDSADAAAAHRYSTSSSDSSTITKITVENVESTTASRATATTTRRPSKRRSSLVYFMDPCIEDSAENTVEGEYNENEQEKPLLDHQKNGNEATIATTYEKHSNYHKKMVENSKSRPALNPPAIRNVEGIELASDVCPFGLAKNLEKQICIIPSRKKKSSGRPSFLKLVTLLLIGSAILITSAAIKEAYY